MDAATKLVLECLPVVLAEFQAGKTPQEVLATYGHAIVPALLQMAEEQRAGRSARAWFVAKLAVQLAADGDRALSAYEAVDFASTVLDLSERRHAPKLPQDTLRPDEPGDEHVADVLGRLKPDVPS